jgi:hypothetical protein
MQQPDFLQAFFAAVIVDKINENNPDYKPFFPNLQEKPEDTSASDIDSLIGDDTSDPFKIIDKYK